MERKVKLGIIGIGNMGSAHAKKIVVKLKEDGTHYCPDIELVAVCDTNPERLEWAKETLGEDVKRFSDPIEMLDSGLLEACVVAVPHYDHPKYVMECLKRGIHVMSEKPAGVYTKAVREEIECAKQHPETIFAMMFNQRTNHIYRKMKELVASGKYGEIRRVNWIITNWYRPQIYYDSGAWRATWAGEGGGVLLNQCPHQLDLLQWITGMPCKVTAKLFYGKWHDIEVEDDATAFLEYPNGATGVFVTTTGDPHGTNRFEIQLDGAQIIAEGGALKVFELEMPEPEFTKTCDKPMAAPEAKEVEVETDGLNEQHAGVLNAFANKILGKGELIARGEEGINGLTLSNAMHLSSWLGKEISIPFDEDLYYSELQKRVATSRLKVAKKTAEADMDSSYSGSKK